MRKEKFINTLVKWYNEVIPGTKMHCKFYLQASTFSFELHDSTKQCFTKDSLVFESKVYWWGTSKENEQIIADIQTEANRTNFKQYTPEQEAKIERLREEAKAKKQPIIVTIQRSKPLQKGDAVLVSLGNKTLSGYIMMDFKSGQNSRYTVKTPLGTVVNIPENQIRRRDVKDLSNVIIPESLKKISTQGLLNMLQQNRCREYESDYWGTHGYTDDELKAELKLRPHITTKGEKRAVNKYKKKK